MHHESNPPIEIKKSSRVTLNLALLGLLIAAVYIFATELSAMKGSDSEQLKIAANHEERIKRLEENQSRAAESVAEMRGDIKSILRILEMRDRGYGSNQTKSDLSNRAP